LRHSPNSKRIPIWAGIVKRRSSEHEEAELGEFGCATARPAADPAVRIRTGGGGIGVSSTSERTTVR
jgi:hypothetical protein